LREAGVDSPELDAELLLAHALGVDRAWLLAHPEHAPAQGEIDAFRAMLARRSRREPLAYITGERWFYDIKLQVTPATLIPRPETEELVERALAWLREHPRATVVDVGTGSGAIALAVARHAPHARVLAIDISAEALAVARSNARRLGLEHRVHFLQGDLLAPLSGPVDLILANLPYIDDRLRASLMPEVGRYEPPKALFTPERGLREIARLLAQAPSFLHPEGLILLEIGHDQGEAVRALAQRAFPSTRIRIQRDLAGQVRFAIIDTAQTGPAPHAHG
jgi:release factor glutamine methyltransferase